MISREQLALIDAGDWLGDWHPLAEQLGSASGLVTLGSIARYLQVPEVQDINSLVTFIENYHREILAVHELPAIYHSQRHAEHNELRELIALDRRIANTADLEMFRAPSRRIGRWQLMKLRPLKDLRIVQRYLAAVQSGTADGWHTIVYGLTLSVYSLPARQGLLGYAHQVTRGHIYTAARDLRLSERECREVFEQCTSSFASLIDGVVRAENLCPEGQVIS